MVQATSYGSGTGIRESVDDLQLDEFFVVQGHRPLPDMAVPRRLFPKRMLDATSEASILERPGSNAVSSDITIDSKKQANFQTLWLIVQRPLIPHQQIS